MLSLGTWPKILEKCFEFVLKISASGPLPDASRATLGGDVIPLDTFGECVREDDDLHCKPAE